MKNNVQRDFGRIVKKARIDYCTLHDLRRTFISHLAMAGVNASVVKGLAGHASIATPQKYYTRVMPDKLRSAQAEIPFDGAIGDGADVSDTYQTEKEGGTDEKPKVINIDQFVG